LRTDPPWSFAPEYLEDIEVWLTGLGPDEQRLLRPRLRERHVGLMAQLDQLPWLDDPTKSADVAVEVLAASIDPADEEGDVPWTTSALKLVESPRLGTRFARAWFVRLLRARSEDVPVSPTVEAVASYTVAAFEVLLGREHEVWIWMQTAACVTEFEGRPGLCLATHVRAARLLRPVLHRPARSTREVSP